MSKDRTILAVCVLLAAGTVFCYQQMGHNSFSTVDDPQYITENSHVNTGITWSGVLWAFRSGYAANWHPLTWISHMLDCNIYGLSPGGHHLTNLILHTANSILLFLVFLRLTSALWRSAFLAASFAWHPVHVESVAWASERKDVLSTFFFLLTIGAYMRYARMRQRSQPADCQVSAQGSPAVWYILSLFLFALALMSKPMVVTLPFVLLLLDVWPLDRLRGSRPRVAGEGDIDPPHIGSYSPTQLIPRLVALTVEKLPFFALAAICSVVTFLVQRAGGAVSSLTDIPLRLRLANAVVAYARYLVNTFWPTHLAAMYPFNGDLPLAQVAEAGLLLAIVSVWAGLRVGRRPWVAVGWFWFLGTLVPAIGIVQVGAQAMADRYMYIPSIGVFLALIWGLVEALQPWQQCQRILAGFGVLALAGCIACTRTQIRFWHDGVTLFKHALEVSKDNYVAFDYMGRALCAQGFIQEGIASYERAVKLKPTYPEGQYNLGTVFMEQGRYVEAVPHFEAVLKSCPTYEEAENNLADTLFKMGSLDQAAAHFRRAIKLKPDDPEARYNFGVLMLAQSNPDEAIVQLSEAVKLKPNKAAAQRNLGVACMMKGRSADGLTHFAEAARLEPHDPENQFNLGLALLDQNRPAEAAPCFTEGARLSPNDARFPYRLGLAMTRLHKSSEAVPHFREALRCLPDFPEAMNELAWILATNPDPKARAGDEAARLAERACELSKNTNGTMVLSLAAAYAEIGRFDEAASTAQKSYELNLKDGRKDAAKKAGEMLDLFRSRQPFREAD